MESNNKKELFSYTYSAKDRAEIEKIRKKYEKKPEKEIDKMEQLRRLDASVTKKATVISLIIGIIGALLTGTGMSLIMTEFSQILGTYEDLSMPIGIAFGVVGIAVAALAYPVYSSISKRQKKRVAPEIIRIADELMENKTNKY